MIKHSPTFACTVTFGHKMYTCTVAHFRLSNKYRIERQSDNLPPFYCSILPRQSARLHMIGYSDISRPNVKLPLVESQHARDHMTSVNPYPHVDINTSSFTDLSAIKG